MVAAILINITAQNNALLLFDVFLSLVRYLVILPLMRKMHTFRIVMYVLTISRHPRDWNMPSANMLGENIG